MYTVGIHLEHKLRELLAVWPQGVPATTKWLESMDISRTLAHKYKASGWLVSAGHGAYLKASDTLEWFGALHALQSQLFLSIHIGGKTALELQGHAHFVTMSCPTIDLLLTSDKKVPKWFNQHKWNEDIRIIRNQLLPASVGLKETMIGNIVLNISTRERAALELLYLAPKIYDYDEVRILIESLGTLQPELLTKLLNLCSSEKVKRLLLYFGEKQGHSWRKYIDKEKILNSSYTLNIINKGGYYDSKYNVFIPREYVIKNEQDIKF